TIKSYPDTANTKVIAMTAYPSAANEKRIKECGAQSCLTKPLDMKVLISHVESVL
ncbi:MAG: response regulator, partial [Planctomycetaceae bacterium]